MFNFGNLEEKRYRIDAKRKDTKEPWSSWTTVSNYEDAVKHAKRVEELCHLARIVDKQERGSKK